MSGNETARYTLIYTDHNAECLSGQDEVIYLLQWDLSGKIVASLLYGMEYQL